jgi:hypothetical protein
MEPIIIAAAMVAVLVGGATSPALAQRSEAGDRGQRLENDALRTDVRRERLKKPSTTAKASRPKLSDRKQ